MTQLRRLKHVADVRFSSVDKKTVDGQVDVKLCNYTDVYYNERILADIPFMDATATLDQIAAYTLRRDDVLLTKDSETAEDIGVTAYVPHDLPGVLCGYHLALARPRPSAIDGRYLRWALVSTASRQQLEVAATGVTRFGLRQDAVGGMTVPVPPMREQAAIANYLDAETARTDQLVERLARANLLLDEWLEAEIEATIWSGEDRLTPLMHLTPGDRQIQYGIVLPGPDVPEGVPIVKGGNIVTGRLQAGGLARTTEEIEAGFARSRLRRNDIVVAIRGAVGACAMVPQEVEGANITQDVARVSPLPGVDPFWLLYALKSRTLQQQVESRILGATIRGINIRDLKRVRVPVPTPGAQQRKAEVLGQAQAHRDRVHSRRQHQIDLLMERRHALITAAVTGQLEIPGVAA